MKVLFLMLTFPDVRKTSNLYTDLANEFVKQGHDVIVIAPAKPSIKCSEFKQENRLKILRVKTLDLFSSNLIIKGLANLALPYQYKRVIKKQLKRDDFDLIILPTPPITLAPLANTLKKKYNAKIYLLLKDIFPQNAADLGLLKEGSFVFNFFRNKEKQLYRISDKIGCMSQGNVNYVINHNPEIDPSKVLITRNCQYATALGSKDFSIKEKYGLKDKFIVIFGGNMGIPQKMENVIAFAKACQKKYDDVRFLLIGEGTQMNSIKDLALKEGVHNIVFKDFIPQADYLRLVALCDIGLISLNEKFTIPNIPSKVMSYFNASLPVLATIDQHTDFGNILESIGAGFYSLAGDTDAIMHKFDRLYKSAELRIEMGYKGRTYLEKKMSPLAVYKTIIDHL